MQPVGITTEEHQLGLWVGWSLAGNNTAQPLGTEAAEQLWELRKQSRLRKSQAEPRRTSKATCLLLGEEDYCKRVGPQLW